jgi:isocitrate dehydrogenase kinase/phosphatase
VTREQRLTCFRVAGAPDPTADVNFLRIPPARTYEEELSAEPYWRVGEHDVFPEQFDRFLVSDPRARELFYEQHRDLLDPAFWQRKQEIVRTGDQEDVFPYAPELRFARTPRAAP